MIRQDQFPLKDLSLWSILSVFGLILVYLIFIALISINVGLNNLHQDGFWMPITAGIIVILGCISTFLVSLRLILNRLGEKESLRI